MTSQHSTDLVIAHQFNITDNFYITPSFNYVFNKLTNESIESIGTFAVDIIDGEDQNIHEFDGFQRFETLGNGSDVAQIALKTAITLVLDFTLLLDTVWSTHQTNQAQKFLFSKTLMARIQSQEIAWSFQLEARSLEQI